MANVPVKWFSHLQTGAPQLVRSYGEMVAVLDAVLITGFNLKTVQSIERVGSVATVTFSVAHGYTKDQVINIYDCAQTEYSGDQIVTSATTNSLTFDVAGTPVTPATSSSDSIKCKAAPIGGWEIQFQSGNRRVYRSIDPGANGNVLRVDNDPIVNHATGKPVISRVHIAQSATDVDTLVNFYPYTTSGTSFPTYGWWKWAQASRYHPAYYEDSTSSADTTTRGWVLIGDARAFYFMIPPNPSGQTSNSYYRRFMNGFGEIISFKPLDVWGTFLWGSESYNVTGSTSTPVYTLGPQCGNYQGINRTSPGDVLLRDYTGVGSAVYAPKITLGTTNRATTTGTIVSGYDTGIPWPNPADYSLILHPTYAGEYVRGIRGIYPGIYCINNNVTDNIPDLTIVDNVTNYANKKFIVVAIDSAISYGNDTASKIAFDITGPWR